MKRILFSDAAKAEVRAIPQHIAMNILASIHRLAQTGSGPVKILKGEKGERRLRVGDYRVRYTEDGNDAIRIHSVRNRKDSYR